MPAQRTARAVPWNSQTPDGQVLLSMPWEVFVAGAAILSIVNLVMAFFVRNQDTDQVIAIMDVMLIVIFSIDVIRRLHVATDRRAYLAKGTGWLDVISIIPLLRVARLLRIRRVSRLMSSLGGPGSTLRLLVVDRAAVGLLLVVFIAILVLEFGSILMLWAERPDPDANILTADEAVWYVIVTMSTVGYGDFYPVSDIGRIIGSLIIVVGVGVFGTLTGFLANAFISPSRKPAAGTPQSVDQSASTDR